MKWFDCCRFHCCRHHHGIARELVQMKAVAPQVVNICNGIFGLMEHFTLAEASVDSILQPFHIGNLNPVFVFVWNKSNGV